MKVTVSQNHSLSRQRQQKVFEIFKYQTDRSFSEKQPSKEHECTLQI